MKNFLTAAVLLLVLADPSPGAVPDGGLRLIPTPRQVVLRDGHFTFTGRVRIFLAGAKDKEDAFSGRALASEIKSDLGFDAAFARSFSGPCVAIGRPASDKVIRRQLALAGAAMPESLSAEGYVLAVTPSGVIVAANTGAGLFYGVQTLKQLIRSNSDHGSIPCLTITDWPELRYRGWMADVSRGPIPTLEFLKSVVRRMAEYKQNFFTLYTEHVFRLRSHPDIAPADGISAEEIGELTRFARDYHCELIGNAQSFGHMENILKSPFYNGMRENGWTLSPSSEETYRFLKEVYAEIVPSYESPFFHINCDEVSGLESGPSKPMVDSLGAGGVYAYHINRVNDLIKPFGKRILMWGDIAVDNPGIIQRLPKDIVVISWGYDPRESFEEAILPFRKTGFEFMVAPGVNCWSEVWPDMGAAAVNISNYVRDGAKLGALGVMNTAWDDDGENFFDYNWHGLLWGAECSWNPARPLKGPEAAADREGRLGAFNAAFDDLLYGLSGVSGTFFLFDSLRHSPVRGAVTDWAVWSSMLDLAAENTGEKARSAGESLVRDAGVLQEKLASIGRSAPRNAGDIDFALFAARRMAFTGRKVIARAALAQASSPGASPEDVSAAKAALIGLLNELHALKAEYVGLWQRENRTWWLDRVLDKYDRLGRELVDLDKTVFIEPENSVSNGKRLVSLRTVFNDQKLYYTTDGSVPNLRSAAYARPFDIAQNALVRARVIDGEGPRELAEKFIMVHRAVGRLLRLNSKYSTYNPAYAAGGPMGLVDGLRGSERFDDGHWQGYQGQDLDIELDLGAPGPVSSVKVSFFQQSYSWVLMPERVQVWTSKDGRDYSLRSEVLNTIDPKQEGATVHDFVSTFKDLKAQYIRIVAKNPGRLPAWHHAAGNESFIFADEIIVE